MSETFSNKVVKLNTLDDGDRFKFGLAGWYEIWILYEDKHSMKESQNGNINYGALKYHNTNVYPSSLNGGIVVE